MRPSAGRASRTATRVASKSATKPARNSARIVATAARWIYDGRRLDMQGLADELGVSRVTLFRRVGSREELISQALWLLTGRMLEIAVARWEAERPEGELHTPGTIRHINAMVAGSAGLRRLLDDEPALTMRVLTDPRGRIQSGIVAFNEDLLRRDMDEFGLVPPRIAGPPPAAQQRDGQQEEDDAAEADPVPVLPLTGGRGGRLLHRRAVRLQVGEDRGRHLG